MVRFAKLIKKWFAKKPLFKVRNEYGIVKDVYKGDTVNIIQSIKAATTTSDTTKSYISGWVGQQVNEFKRPKQWEGFRK